MKHYLWKFGGNLLALALIGVVSLTALAGPRPFHLVEHGKLTVTPRDERGTVLDIVANGTGTATHLGAITVQRTATLTATSTPGVFDFNGEATLTAASGEILTTTITGTFNAVIGHADWSTSGLAGQAVLHMQPALLSGPSMLPMESTT